MEVQVSSPLPKPSRKVAKRKSIVFVGDSDEDMTEPPPKKQKLATPEPQDYPPIHEILSQGFQLFSLELMATRELMANTFHMIEAEHHKTRKAMERILNAVLLPQGQKGGETDNV